MLWIDKYRPKNLDSLSFNPDLTQKLRKICGGGETSGTCQVLSQQVACNDLPHMIIGGPDGCGKKSRIMACLNQVYGESVHKMRIQHREYKLPSKKIIELTTVTSNHHIEIDISEARHSNRVIIQEIVDEITGGNGFLARGPLKIIVLYHAEFLSKATQHSLRKTIEQYSATCRFIISTNSFSKIIDQLHSRAFVVRVESPDNQSVLNILQDIATKENVVFNPQIFTKIVENSHGNLGNAIMTLQRVSLCSGEILIPSVIEPDIKTPPKKKKARVVRSPVKKTKKKNADNSDAESESASDCEPAAEVEAAEAPEPESEPESVEDVQDNTGKDDEADSDDDLILIKPQDDQLEFNWNDCETNEPVIVNFNPEKQLLPMEDWEDYIVFLVETILSVQTVASVINARENIYELIGKCLEPDLIFKRLVFELLSRVDLTLKKDIIYFAAKYEYAIVQGGKAIIHIEAFVVKCMELYKQFLLQFGDETTF